MTSSSLGFGLERAGLPPIRYPRITMTLMLILSVISAFGLPQIQAAGELSQLFRSPAAIYTQYEKMAASFPTSEFDALMVIQGDDLADPEKLEAIRNASLELQFVEGVTAVMSMFSMREPPDEKGHAALVIPDELPEGKAFTELFQKILAHPLIGGRFLSEKTEDGQIALLVISLAPDLVEKETQGDTLKAIAKTAREFLEPVGLTFRLAGAPVLGQEIHDAINVDRIKFNVVGFLFGSLICLAFFRRLSLVLIAASAPLFALLWVVGTLGLMGQKLNIFINVIPPLIMVIAFSDAMHMVFAIRHRLRQGDDRYAAARHAILSVGPACVLTSLTTTVAMLSLTLTDSGLIREFGFAAAFGTMVAFFGVVIAVPTMAVLIIRNEKSFVDPNHKQHEALAFLDGVSRALGQWVVPRYRMILSLGILLLVIFATLHLQLGPRYRLSDHVPDNREAIHAAQVLDARLKGSQPLHILVSWPEGETILAGKGLAALTAAHRILEETPEVSNVWSLETLRRWLQKSGNKTTKLADYLDKMPKYVQARFLNTEKRLALISGQFRDLEAKETLRIIAGITQKLKDLEAAYPGMQFSVTGLAAVSAQQSYRMISQLNLGLLAAIVVVILLLGLAFRSWKTAALSVIPNLFPIVAVGSYLFVTDSGLQYAGVMALTVAFGLAVDDSIHFLHRFHQERQRRRDTTQAVQLAIAHVGPVLILTTLVLVCGLAVTILSDLPVTRLFGELSVATLLAALVADLLILPALILGVRQWERARRPSVSAFEGTDNVAA